MKKSHNQLIIYPKIQLKIIIFTLKFKIFIKSRQFHPKIPNFYSYSSFLPQKPNKLIQNHHLHPN